MKMLYLITPGNEMIIQYYMVLFFLNVLTNYYPGSKLDRNKNNRAFVAFFPFDKQMCYEMLFLILFLNIDNICCMSNECEK